MLRFDDAAEAKKFVNLYNDSASIFGDKYKLKVQLFSDTQKALDAPFPIVRESQTVDLSSTF